MMTLPSGLMSRKLRFLVIVNRIRHATETYKLFGVNLTQIPGLMMLVFMLFSEVGRDMSRWPTSGNFVSWLGLCPDNDISFGTLEN